MRCAVRYPKSGCPLWSLAGVNRARRRRMLQVALSSERRPGRAGDVAIGDPAIGADRQADRGRALLLVADRRLRIVVGREQRRQIALGAARPATPCGGGGAGGAGGAGRARGVITGGGATGVVWIGGGGRVDPHQRRRRDHLRRRRHVGLLRRGRRLLGRGRRLVLDVEGLQFLGRLLDDIIGKAGDQGIAEQQHG